MNYRNHIRELVRNRQEWLTILNKNPNNSTAAESIVHLNAQLQLLNTLRFQDGDYDIIEGL